MLLRAYSIFDNKALQYHPPFFASTDASAVRSVRDLVDDGNTTVGRHPGDYVLYAVGEWDDQTGRFAPLAPLVHIVDAISLLSQKPTPLFKETA